MRRDETYQDIGNDWKFRAASDWSLSVDITPDIDSKYHLELLLRRRNVEVFDNASLSKGLLNTHSHHLDPVLKLLIPTTSHKGRYEAPNQTPKAKWDIGFFSFQCTKLCEQFLIAIITLQTANRVWGLGALVKPGRGQKRRMKSHIL